MFRNFGLLFLVIISFALFMGCEKDSTSPKAETTTPTEYTELDTLRTSVKDYGLGTGTMTWTSDRVWILDGFVFVNDGQTLTIQPGTIIKGRSGQGANASALIVARGGKLIASGTATDPIVFTAESDGNTMDDLQDLGVRGLWGGVILLGKAQINTAAGEGQIEGIPEDEPRGAYGGSDDTDNSGTLKYVSIRYGGTEIGQANEINGLTFGAVGNGTTIDYVEVVYNQDDGYEWFGGTVNTFHLISAFNGDDCFDYDEGFRGNGQFWFGLQAADAGDKAGEHDGGTDPEDGMPFAIPVISNITYIGSGAASGNPDNRTFTIRDNAGSKYYNSIFYDFATKAMSIEDLSSGEDSRARLDVGDIDFRNNIWYSFGAGNVDTLICSHDYERVLFTDTARKNWVIDPQLAHVDRMADCDPRPGAAAAVGDVFTVPNHTATNYLGAFEPGANLWVADWSFVSTQGYTVQ
jgi:hypothetical protein